MAITPPVGSAAGLEPVVGEHRAVDAEEQLAQLAVAAQTDPALHVALHRQPDARRARRRARSGPARRTASSPRGRRPARACAPGRTRHERPAAVTSPTCPRQPRVPASTISSTSTSCVAGPGVEVCREQDVLGRPRAVEQTDPAVRRRGRRRPPGSPDAAGRARCRRRRRRRRRRGRRPTSQPWPNGSADPERRCRARRVRQDAGDTADVADRVLEHARDAPGRH